MSFPGPGRKGPPPPNRDQAPSDSQSKEKLIVYVYEYLTHNGAPETARHFLQEIGQPPNITLQNDAPGFLQSWWNVFWDLYCAAPERRETCDHSVEARVFHDHFGLPQMNGIHGQHAYPSSSASPLGMPGPSGPDGFPPGGPQGLGPGGPPFMGGPLRQSQGQPGVSQPSPHSGAVGSMPNVPPFAGGPRYPRGPMPPMGMGPGGPEMRFNGPPVGMFPEHLRPNSVPPHMLGPGGPHQRLGPSNSMGPVRNMGPSPSPIQHFNPNMRNPQPNLRPPMSMNNGWSPSTSAGGGMMSNGPGPGTPIMPSPQNMPSESSGERYHVLGSHAPSFAPMNSDVSGGGGQEVVMNGDDLKNSPAGSSHGRNGGTPGSQHGQGPNSVPPSSQAPGSAESMDHYSAPAFADNSNRYQEQSEIQKIKESMMAETRQFESGKDGSDSGSEFLGCM